MGREIDERVVQMKFENGQFEKGISTSIRSMEELKKGMDFDDAVKGFNKLDEAAKGMKLSGLASGVEAVRVKFDLLQITAFNVLNRISNKAIDTGERMVKGLSIDQVAVGWSKFADKTGSVQTIMSATAKQFTDTGEQMAYVNEQLDKLNWFTDETSYNFVDMVNNIGKFTSNNIALEDSVTAMQGIANWAAISGANANEASRAMYNISQALSSGAVRLEDWMSIENANMGTAAFKELAIQMAVTAGTLKKQGDKIVTINKGVEVSVENFRNTLTEDKWLNKDVLMATLNQYGQATNKLNSYYEETGLLTSELVGGIDDYIAGVKTAEEISGDWGLSLEKTQAILEDFNNEQDQFGLKAFKAAQEAKTFEDAINSVKDAVSTGWMKSFEYIFGDYLEAKEFFTDLANTLYEIFAAGGEQRNENLKFWKAWGGRERLIDAIWNALSLVLAILKPIQVAWTNVFGEMSAVRLLNLTAKLQRFMETLAQMAENNMPRLERTFSGLFAVIDIFMTALRSAGSAIGRIVSALFPFAGGIFEATASLGDMLVMLDKVIKETKIFDRIFGSIADVLIGAINAIRSFTSAVAELIFGAEKINKFSSALWTPVAILEAIFDRLSAIANGIGEIFNKIVSAFKNGGNSLESLSSIFSDALEGLTNPFGDGALNGLLDVLNSGLFAALLIQLKKFIDKLGGFDITKLFKNFRNAFEELGETIGAFEANINAQTLRIIASAILMLAAALLVLASINPERLTGALAAISVLFIELSISMKAFSKAFSGKFSIKVTKVSSLMIGFSAAILILSSALKKLSEIDTDSLVNGLGATIALIVAVTIALKVLSTVTKKIRVGSIMLISLAASINILAIAVGKLGSMNVYQLRDGLLSVGALLGELAIFINLISGAKISMRSSAAILAISASLSVLSDVLNTISSISEAGMQSSIIAIGALLTEIGLFMKFGGKEKGLISLGVSLTIFSSAISILSKSLVNLSSLSMQNIVEGIIGIGAALGTVGLTMHSFPKNSTSIAIGLTLVATALNSIISSVTEYSDLKSIAVGLVAVGASLIVIGTGLRFMQKNGLKDSITLIAFAAALKVLTPALKELSEIGLKKLITTLGGLAIAFAGLGLVAAVIEPISPALRSLSVTIGIFSVSILALGAGVTMLSAGLASLGGSAVFGIGGLTVAIRELAKLIPVIAKEIGFGVVTFSDAIAEGAPRIANAVIALVMAALDALSETVPEIVDRLLEIFQKIIQTLIERIPSLGEALTTLFSGFSVEGFKEFAIALSLILWSIVGSMKMLKKSKGISFGAIETLGVMLVGVGIIAAILSKFSSMTDPNKVIPLATGVSEVLLALSASFSIIGKFGKDFKIDLTSIGIMSAAIGAIGFILGLFSNMANPTSVIPLATALSMVMVSLAATMKIMSTIKTEMEDSLKNVTIFGALSIIVGILGAVVAGLSVIQNPEAMIPIATGLSLLMLALSGVVYVISNIKDVDMATSVKVIGVMLLVVAALAAVVAALGGLMQLQGFQQIMSDGGTAMMLLGRAIGGFFGGIVGGFAEGLASALPGIGTSLSQFMENAQGFFDGVTKIPGNLIGAVGELTGAMILLGAAEFITAIEGFLTWIVTLGGKTGGSMADQFKEFGEALAAFSEGLGDDFDADKVEKAAKAGKMLAELERSLPAQGGKLEKWVGKKDLSEFGSRLKDFGRAIARFSATVKGKVDSDAVEAAVAAGKALAGLEDSLPAQGGKLQTWIGEKDLSDFGQRLKYFGRAIVRFSNIVKGNVDELAVEAAANAGSLLATLENSLSSKGGMLQDLLGEKSLSTFGDNLSDLGEGLYDFSDYAKDISVKAITAATGALAALVALESQVTTSGGWGEIFTGKSDFSSFADNLRDLGEGLESYDNSLAVVELEDIKDATSALEDIIALGKTPSSAFEGLITLANNLVAIGPSIKDWSDTATSASIEAMGDVTDEIENLLKLSELTSASQWIQDIVACAGSMVYQLTTSLQSKHATLYNAGKDIAYWLVAGIKQGMKDEQSGANEAAANCAKGVQEAFEDEAGIASPSTVMIEEGHWLMKGLAEGITSDMSAEDAAAKKAQNIVSAFQEVTKQLDLMSQNRQLKYEVWSVNEGLGASDYEKQQYELNLKIGKFEDAAKKAQAQNAAFEVAKKTFAEGSQQYIEAENNMLTAMKEMYTLRNEISQMQSSLMNANPLQSKNDAYIGYIKENEEAYKMLGWSQEKLIEDAKQKSGFGLDTGDTISAKTVDLQAIVDKAIGPQQVEIAKSEVAKRVSGALYGGIEQGLSGEEGTGSYEDKIYNDILAPFQGNGASRLKSVLGYAGASSFGSYVEGGVNALKDGYDKINNAGYGLGQKGVDGVNEAGDVNSPSKVMYQTGIYFGQGLINGLSAITPETKLEGQAVGNATIEGLTQGINEKGTEAIAAAKAVADAVAAQMRRALMIRSPSRLTRKFGNYLDEGLALGMRDNIPDVTKATNDVGNAMAAALDDAKYRVNDIIESDDDFSPVITPVLNLSDIEKQGRTLGRTLNRQGFDLSAARLKVGDIADQTAFGQNGSSKLTSQTNYNFTQNNYSPKALNRSEIYRQTNNQFSRLKGASQR